MLTIARLTVLLLGLSCGIARADTLIEWAQDKDGPKTYTIDGVTLSLSPDENTQKESPKLTVSSPKGASATIFGAERLFPDIPVNLRVTHLDPSHSDVDIMFGIFTGGAHCCVAIKVLSLVKGEWKIIDFGNWDGDTMPEPKENDNSGMITLTFNDDSFLYAFASYAESFAPLQIFEVSDGRKIDVSSSPALLQLHRQNMIEARKSCAEHSNSGCAAYVASAARLGMLPEAWDFMLKNYDRQSDWTLEFCDIAGPDKCERTVSFDSFPKALDWFLHKHGYLTADQSPRTP